VLSTLLVILAGCAAPGRPGTAGDSGPGGPHIVVTPAAVAFGSLWADLGQTAVRTVTVGNDGDADLHLDRVGLDSVGGPLDLGALTGTRVQPGATEHFSLTFHPEEEGSWAFTVTVRSDEPPVEVPVSGSGTISPLRVEVPDLGEVSVGCAAEGEVVASNTGAAPLDLLAVELSDATGAFTLGEGPTGTLEPGASVSWPLTFAPLDEDAFDAVLSFVSDDAVAPVQQVAVEGEGRVEQRATDTWTADDPRVDVLFVVDTSGSNYDNVAILQQTIKNLFPALDAAAFDWQVLAVVRDDGCTVVRPWVDPTTADPVALFTALTPYGGAEPSYAEQGFTLALAALDHTGTAGCNDGLLRTGAPLHVVGFSDEGDQSPGTTDDALTALRAFVDRDDLLVVHAIGGDVPTGCGSATPYTGFYEATVETGGSFSSICSTDRAAWFTRMADRVAANRLTTDYPLSATPVAGTVALSIDGAPTIEFSLGEGAIRLPETPAAGALVVADYVVQPACASATGR